MRRLERLVSMALFFSSRRRVLAREVADAFGISLRTVYRDVRALVEGGFPLEGNAGDGYRLGQGAFLRPLALTADEAEALTIATRAFAVSAPPAMRDSLARASTKLETSLDRDSRRRVLDLQARIAVPEALARGGGAGSGPMTEVLEAVRARHVARIVYTDLEDRRSERDVEPLGLVCVGPAWWLVAYCRLRADARAFRVDRIERWTDRGEAFAGRPGLSFTEAVARDRHLGKELFGY